MCILLALHDMNKIFKLYNIMSSERRFSFDENAQSLMLEVLFSNYAGFGAMFVFQFLNWSLLPRYVYCKKNQCCSADGFKLLMFGMMAMSIFLHD